MQMPEAQRAHLYEQRRVFVMNALRQCRYRSEERVQQDVLQVLYYFPTLNPSLCQEQRGLLLTGTIPINFKGNNYNIPVRIFITDFHPASQPMCHVTPTAQMAIKDRHQHCDAQGFIYHPYLNQWSPNSTLLELVRQLVQVFGQNPPVTAMSARSGPRQAKYCYQPPQQQAPVQQRPPQQQQYGTTQQQQQYGTQAAPPAYQSVAGGPVAYRQQQQALQAQQQQQRTQQQREQLLRRVEATMELQLGVGGRQEERELAQGQARVGEAERGIESALSGISAAEKGRERLEKEIAVVSGWLDEQGGGGIDIDKVTQSPSALTQQYVDLLAEERAYDDALYAIGNAFMKQSQEMSTADFLTSIRRTARKQFYAAALGNKVTMYIQQGAGRPPATSPGSSYGSHQSH